MPDAFKDLLQWCNDQQPRYVDASRDPAAAQAKPWDIIEEIAGRISEILAEDEMAAISGKLSRDGSSLQICTSIALASVFIRRGCFRQARDLLAFVQAKVPLDLVVQRCLDAAEGERSDLSHPVDAWLKDRFCPRPFDQVETLPDQNIHFCPMDWQPAPIGSLSDAPGAVWNSPGAQEIRRSVLDGDFAYCSRWHCPHIRNKSLIVRQDSLTPEDRSPEVLGYREIISSRTTRIEKPPELVALSHDRSCNLSCPSCRTRAIELGKYDADRLDRLVGVEHARFFSGARRIIISRDGEPFSSSHYLNFLKTYCASAERKKGLHLTTSGLLLTEAVWDQLYLWGHVSTVVVSVDAASASTYQHLRRGGSLGDLLPNLAFLGALRRQREIDAFHMAFLVQQGNFREMPDFVRLARQTGADRSVFQRLKNWNTYKDRAFDMHDVADPAHPDHEQLLLVMQDPVLSGSDVDFDGLLGVDAGACDLPA